ncbi:IS1182 family transposase [Aquimarina celericrescens]|uniref:IS1182 family transposase n=1 Tax=Aquimarina celericrescens TaxID=1964542 RepID=A0ABW5AZC0_9FLAO|nr:IS1182 family transposase [Aquimarina celericrescens]
MQGKKTYQEKLFNNFHLSDRVPATNFYRRLKDVLHLDFLYKDTKQYYGDSGQKSIDPLVFFKLCLVGYLENIISDRKLIAHASMRLDILYFLGYDIDEELPWHSTISGTRQLFPEEVFEKVFTHVFKICVDQGMVNGSTQAIDSAPVKANASMDSLELKVPQQDLEAYLSDVRYISNRDKETYRKAKENKASKEQRKITASDKELKEIRSRNKNWSENQNQRPGAGNKGSRYTSNKTHYSPTDPDARISVKPGKARKLNYHSQLSVDTANHVITDIKAYHADGKDNQDLPDIVDRLSKRLWRSGFRLENVLADTGYSSGENYAYLEQKGITGYIPPHGTYKGGPDGFIYVEKQDHYICPYDKIVPFKKVFNDYRTGTKKKDYRISSKICSQCPLASSCLGKSAKEKKFSVTYYRAEYERNKQRLKTEKGRRMKVRRQATVEPVFGTLTQFMGLRKINTIGIKQANKVMHLSAMAYNLKKYLKFVEKRVKSGAGTACSLLHVKNTFYHLVKLYISNCDFIPCEITTK